jgi:hypothetical protein
LGRGYPEQRNGKNNVCKGIYVAEEHYNKSGRIGLPQEACFTGPLEDYSIYEINNECDADQKGRITGKITIIVRDHEVDDADTEQYDHQRFYDPEIGSKIQYLAEDQVFDYPNEAGDGNHDIKNTHSVARQPPDFELPGNK